MLLGKKRKTKSKRLHQTDIKHLWSASFGEYTKETSQDIYVYISRISDNSAYIYYIKSCLFVWEKDSYALYNEEPVKVYNIFFLHFYFTINIWRTDYYSVSFQLFYSYFLCIIAVL